MENKKYIIDKFTIEKIMDAAQIVDVISEFVSLKRRGVNYIGLCPFHSDKTPSFSVSPSKNICKCFACGEGGSAVHFIMKHEQLSYFEALKYLADKYNIEVKVQELTDEQKEKHNERESLFIITEYARDYFVNNLHNTVEGKTIAMPYFRERGFRTDIIQKFQLGYSLEQRDAFAVEALRKGYDINYLTKTGLVIQNENRLSDRFRGRIIFPIHTISGRVTGFGGRILKKIENTGKYVNSPESPIYSKSKELYGIYFAKQAIVKEDRCFLVEGYTDVLSLHQAGIENVVSSSGTALTLGQIKMIHRFTTNVTLIYDGDEAGIKAALRGIDLLLEEGLNIKVVLLPEGEDPDSFAKKQNAASFHKYIIDNETDFIQFKTKVLLKDAENDPIKKTELITDLVHTISIIPNDIQRTIYIKNCSIILQIDEQVLVRAVTRKMLDILNKPKELRTRNEGIAQTSSVSPQQTSAGELQYPQKSQPSEILPFIQFTRNTFTKYEHDIIYFVIRYGQDFLIERGNEKALAEAGEDANLRVIDYVEWDLERDGIIFSDEKYKFILEEAIAMKDEPDFIPSKYFLAHPRADISIIAANMLTDKYEYSKIHLKPFGSNTKIDETPLSEKKHLHKTVPWVVTELKGAYIDTQIKQVMKELSTEKDSEKQKELLEQLVKLKEIKNFLAKFLGERVVLKKSNQY